MVKFIPMITNWPPPSAMKTPVKQDTGTGNVAQKERANKSEMVLANVEREYRMITYERRREP
jgi:hypothetical protein